MASASSKSAKTLFAESKARLADRVHVNVNNMGSITRQVQRGSKSNDLLAQASRHFCQAEAATENSFNNLQRAQVLLAQLAQQNKTMENQLSGVKEVQEQIRDMQR